MTYRVDTRCSSYRYYNLEYLILSRSEDANTTSCNQNTSGITTESWSGVTHRLMHPNLALLGKQV